MTKKRKRTFTLEEARAALPCLNELLASSAQELKEFALSLQTANEAYEIAEDKLARIPSHQTDNLRRWRQNFACAVKELSSMQQKYVERLDFWLDEIAATGVILRDLKAGLVDFPCQEGSLEYFLCWRQGEADIRFWHLPDDGFIGRKPIAALTEYITD